jgi:hypothetical protein
LRPGSSGEYLDRNGMKFQDSGQNYPVRISIICTPTYYKVEQIREDEMGGLCGTHGRDEKCVNFRQ